MKSQVVSASILLIVACWFGAANSAEPCIPKFKNFQALKAAGDMCAQKIANATAGAAAKNNTKQMKMGDMCAANCTMSELKMFSNATILTTALVNMINENAPEAAKAKLVALVNTCADRAMKKDDKMTHAHPKLAVQNKAGKQDSKTKDKKMGKMLHMKGCHIAHKFMTCFDEGEKVC